MMQSECDLTVIVACVEASQSIESCLTALFDACVGVSTQIIVVDASRDDTAAIVRARWPGVELRRFGPGTLVPLLWTAGVEAAHGRVVAFTTGQLSVTRTWARALVHDVSERVAMGGPLILADDARTLDGAIFYLRYSAMLPSQLPDGPVSGEIAGDNAAYSRAALARHASWLRGGFWEVDFHRRFRAEGGRLAATTKATAVFTRSSPFGCIAWHRYLHGRQFGASRVAAGLTAVRIVAAAPLVPLVLAWRAGRRTLAERQHWRRFLTSLPVFLALATSWAIGEAHGALAGTPPTARTPSDP